MKTLDEVIEAERHCIGNGCRGCPYDIVTYGGSCECNEDVLHYLEKYREAKDCEEILTDYVALKQYWEEQQENDPLTWDELKQMEGKPVWVEYGCDSNQKRWVIIGSFHGRKNEFQYMDVSGGYPNTFWKKDMGADEYWQAYRKERG